MLHVYGSGYYIVYQSANDADNHLIAHALGNAESLLKTDTFSQGDQHGNENDVSHLKYSGIINRVSYYGQPVASKFEYIRTIYNGKQYRLVFDSTRAGYTYTQIPLDNNEYTVIWKYDVDWGTLSRDRGGRLRVSAKCTTYYEDGRAPDYATTWFYIVYLDDTKPLYGDLVRQHLNDSFGKTPKPTRVQRNLAFRYAVCDAIDSIQPLEVNNLENVRDVVGLLHSLASVAANPLSVVNKAQHLSKRAKRLLKKTKGKAKRKQLRKVMSNKAADEWLQYRYVYTTTKMDIEAYIKELQTALNHIVSDNASLPRKVRGRYRDGDTLYCASATIIPTTNSDVLKAIRVVEQLGFRLSLTNLWDLVPMSFVLDWLMPIQNFCQVIDREFIYSQYSWSPWTYSIKRTAKLSTQFGGTVTASDYSRWVEQGHRPIFLYTPSSVSNETIVKRFVDAAALTQTIVNR